MPVRHDEADKTSVLHRVSSILGAFETDRRLLSLSDLVERTGIPRASVHRIATALVDEQLLEREGTLFGLGLRVFELGHRVPRQQMLTDIATPFMADLREATGHTVNLAVIDKREIVYVELLRGKQPPPNLRKARVGGRLPAHTTGVGKALLAHAGPATIDEYLSMPLEPFGPRTICDPTVLRRELVQILKDGVAYDHEESADGVVCAACPIFARDGRPVAGLSLSGWSHRVVLEHSVAAVRTTAMAISRGLAGGFSRT